MASRISRLLAVGALSISCFVSAAANYSSIDMLRAQAALMDDRPSDCPPWYVSSVAKSLEDLLTSSSLVAIQLQLHAARIQLRPVRRV